MKNKLNFARRYFLCLLVAATVIVATTVSSCKKKQSDTASTRPSITATFDIAYTGTNFSTDTVSSGVKGVRSFLSVDSAKAGYSLELDIDMSQISVGTHRFHNFFPYIRMEYVRPITFSIPGFQMDTDSTDAGTLVITKNDGSTISGTFSGTMYGSGGFYGGYAIIPVTNGKFSNIPIK